MIGGGLAGLAAAASASQAGARVLTVEAHQPGGRARTVEREGFTLNMGGHALYAAGAGVGGAPFARHHAPRGSPSPPPLPGVGRRGPHLLPTGPGSLLRTGAVGPRSKAQLAGLLVRVPRIKPETLARTSVAEWLASCRLRPDAEAVLRTLIRLGTYTADVDGVQRRCRRLPIAGGGATAGCSTSTAGGASSSKHWSGARRSHRRPRSPASTGSGTGSRSGQAKARWWPTRWSWPPEARPRCAVSFRPTPVGATSDRR